MAKLNTEKSLTIKRESYEGVTEIPHFPIEIHYVGHHVVFEDIYFDNPTQFMQDLKTLEINREGEVLLDGGLRLKIYFKANLHGGITVSFRSEEFEPSFPGQCILEGYFLIEGEHIRQLVNSVEMLFWDGIPFSIKQAA